MRSQAFFNTLLAVLLWTLILASYTNATSWLEKTQHHPSLPFQFPNRPQQASDSRIVWTKLRDGLVHVIWGLPAKAPTPMDKSSLSTPSLPPSMLARYGGDIVLRFQIRTAEEATALAEASNILFLDVWESTMDWVDIRIAKDVVPSLLGLLPSSLQHAHRPLMHDLAQTIYESFPAPAFSDPSTPDSPPHTSHQGFSPAVRNTPNEVDLFFRNYQPLSVILPWMRLLNSMFPTHVRLTDVGMSYEGRSIPALRVGVHPTNSEKPMGLRKTIVITGGSHAREWISTSTVNYAAWSMITDYGKSKQITNLLEDFDWIFIPTLNPDGYVFTWENDRLWRKNRQETSLRFCRGLDLDRSYGFEWDGESTRSNPCSESYAGDQAFEGVESLRLANWVKNETLHNNVDFVGFLDFHSYSQQVLYPYSYTCTSTPPALENLEELATGLAKAIRQVNGENYGVTSACEGNVGTPAADRHRIESGGGSMLDYFHHEVNVKYAYQIKLRDTGSYGFLLPSKNILPTGKEAFAAVTYFGKYLQGNKGIEQEKEEVEPTLTRPTRLRADRHASGATSTPIRLQEFDVEVGEDFATPPGSNDDGAAEVSNLELRKRRRR